MIVQELVQELAPERDAHLGAVSVLSLLKYHVEMQPLLKFLPGWKAEHEEAEIFFLHWYYFQLFSIFQS